MCKFCEKAGEKAKSISVLKFNETRPVMDGIFGKVEVGKKTTKNQPRICAKYTKCSYSIPMPVKFDYCPHCGRKIDDKNHKVIKSILTYDIDGLNTNLNSLEFEVDENVDFIQAVKDACKEYCLTDEGKKTFEGNCNCFNWGDFDAYVPDSICNKYGIRKLSSVLSEEHDFNETLVDETEIFSEE